MFQIGNALIDDTTMGPGYYDHVWTHALISDETHSNIFKFCDFANDSASDECYSYAEKSYEEMGNIDIDNMYAPICLEPVLKNGSSGSVSPSTNWFCGLRFFLAQNAQSLCFLLLI